MNLSPRAERVLNVLEAHRDEPGPLNPAQAAIEAGYSPRSFRRGLLELRRCGLALRIAIFDREDGCRCIGYRYELANQVGQPNPELAADLANQDAYWPQLPSVEPSRNPSNHPVWPTPIPLAILNGQPDAPSYIDVYVGGISISSTSRDAVDVSVSSESQLSAPAEPIVREPTTSDSSIASFDPENPTPTAQDLTNVAAVERELDSAVASASGRRDLATAIRFHESELAAHVRRLAKSEDVDNRAGALIGLVREHAWHEPPFDPDGRCRSCRAHIASELWCPVCAGAHHPPVWGSAPLTEAERAAIRLREAERREQHVRERQREDAWLRERCAESAPEWDWPAFEHEFGQYTGAIPVPQTIQVHPAGR